MKQLPRIFTTRFRVRYAETDQMGVVYHANYLVWFEMGRTEMLRELGFSYRQLEADGCALPVAEVTCRYRAPARYDEELELESRVLALRGPVIKFAYRLLRPPGSDGQATLLAEATTTHVVVDRELRRTALPQPYADLVLASLGE